MLKKKVKTHGKGKGLYVYITKEEVEIHKLKPGDIIEIHKSNNDKK